MHCERVHGIIAKYGDRLRSHSIIMQSQCTVKKNTLAAMPAMTLQRKFLHDGL